MVDFREARRQGEMLPVATLGLLRIPSFALSHNEIRRIVETIMRYKPLDLFDTSLH